MQAGSVYTLTTATGQHMGTVTPPPQRPFPMPYLDDFEHYSVGTDAVNYFSKQNGSFVVTPCANRKGQCLHQVAVSPPIWWTYGADAHRLGTPNVIGDARWRDYAYRRTCR